MYIKLHAIRSLTEIPAMVTYGSSRTRASHALLTSLDSYYFGGATSPVSLVTAAHAAAVSHPETFAAAYGVGGTTHGAFILADQMTAVFHDVFASLQLTHAYVAFHQTMNGRTDYHVVLVNVTDNGRSAFATVKDAQNAVRERLWLHTQELNRDRLNTGRFTIGNYRRNRDGVLRGTYYAAREQRPLDLRPQAAPQLNTKSAGATASKDTPTPAEPAFPPVSPGANQPKPSPLPAAAPQSGPAPATPPINPTPAPVAVTAPPPATPKLPKVTVATPPVVSPAQPPAVVSAPAPKPAPTPPAVKGKAPTKNAPTIEQLTKIQTAAETCIASACNDDVDDDAKVADLRALIWTTWPHLKPKKTETEKDSDKKDESPAAPDPIAAALAELGPFDGDEKDKTDKTSQQRRSLASTLQELMEMMRAKAEIGREREEEKEKSRER